MPEWWGRRGVKVNVEIQAALARVVSPNLDIDASGKSPDPHAMLLAELADFVARHRACGQLTGDATEPEANGYMLSVACSCGVTFPSASPHNSHAARLIGAASAYA